MPWPRRKGGGRVEAKVQRGQDGTREENEYDWGGRILEEIAWMGGRSKAEKFLESAVSWKEIKPELKQLVRDEVERRQLEKTKGLKKGQEEDKAPWSRDW